MRQSKPLGKWTSGDVFQGPLTPRTFVRAARFATRLIIVLVSIEFGVLALVFRDGKVLLVGITLLSFMTVAIWATAAVLGVLALSPDWFRASLRRLDRRTGPPSGPSEVWDAWLDGPSRP